MSLNAVKMNCAVSVCDTLECVFAKCDFCRTRFDATQKSGGASRLESVVLVRQFGCVRLSTGCQHPTLSLL